MAGHDKERDRGHDHPSNGSTVQAAGVELARQELRTYAVSRPSLVQRPSPRLSSMTQAPSRKVMGVPGQRSQAARNVEGRPVVCRAAIKQEPHPGRSGAWNLRVCPKTSGGITKFSE